MRAENTGIKQRVESLESQLSLMELQAKASNESQISLSNKISKIESQKDSYSNKAKELEKDEKTKNLLDTRLPDDLKRLLDEAIQTD